MPDGRATSNSAASSRNTAELAAVLRTACDFSVMTDDEVAAVLEEGDDYDQMARAALDWFARRHARP